MQRRKFVHGREHTNPFIWFAAIICTIITIAVILAGLGVFVGYLIIQPKVPFISVTYAHLDNLEYDQAGLMAIQMTLNIRAENDNAKAHATFSETDFLLLFDGLQIARLAADPFDVPKNKSVDLSYIIPSSSIPLETDAMEEVSMALQKNKIIFKLKGDVRTRWRVGILGSVKFSSHLNCQLQFFPSNGSSINLHCNSKGK